MKLGYQERQLAEILWRLAGRRDDVLKRRIVRQTFKPVH